MKYVLTWRNRPGSSAQENLASTKRSLEVFAKWSPSTTIHQFVSRVDGEGGFAVGETDDLTALARDCAVFSPFLEIQVYPVLDVEQGIEALRSGVEFNRSV